MVLDAKDKKILLCLNENARYSYSTIARKCGLSRDVIKYRIDKLIEDGVIDYFTISLFRPGLGIMETPHMYLRLDMISSQKMKDILKELCQEEDIVTLATCEGRFNVYLRILAKDKKHLRAVIDKIKLTCGHFLVGYSLINISGDKYLKGQFFWDDENTKLRNVKTNDRGSFQHLLLKAKSKNIPQPYNLPLDNADLAILSILRKDCRTKINHIAKELKLDPLTVRRRIESMIEKRFVHTFHPIINPLKVGFYEHHLLIRLAGSKEEQTKMIQKIKNDKHASYVALCHSEWDFLFKFTVKGTHYFSSLMDKIMKNELNFINRYETLYITKVYKDIKFQEDVKKIYENKESSFLVPLLETR